MDPREAPATKSIDVPPLSLRADVRAESINVEARTAEVIFSTGAPVERFDWMSGTRYLETLSLKRGHVRLGRLNNGAPLLNAHGAWSIESVLGVVVSGSARLTDGEGTAVVRFSKREDVEPIFRDVVDGIVRNVSVGYRVHKYEQSEGDGKLPVRHAIDWEPFEISAVPMGADDGAKLRATDKTLTNPCVIVSRTAANEESAMTPDEQRAADEAAAAQRAADEAARAAAATATVVATPSPIDIEAAATRAAIAERERGAAIRKLVRGLKLDEKIADELVSRGATVETARSEVLDVLTKRDAETETFPPVRIVGAEADRLRARGIDWLLTKAGVADRVVAAAKLRGETVRIDPGEFRGMSLQDLARECLERAGVKTRGMDKHRMVGMALTQRDGGGGGGYQTTNEFPVLLETAMNKTLLAAYGTTPDTWTMFAATGSVSDFRPHLRYRMGTFSRLDLVGEGGEFKNKPIPDGLKEVVQAVTKGNIIALTRQAIINDDMGAFTRLATMLGRAAKLSIEMDVYDLLALNAGLGPIMNDGLTLFHATHLNIGAPAAISVASLDADRVLMASQRDPSGNEILDIRPEVLLLPVGLGGAARVFNQSQYEPTANLFQKPNVVVGLFRTVVDTPRLTGTRRYMFANPQVAQAIEVFFLDGQQEPFLETKDGWRIDGVEWKVRLDYGVDAVDWVGALTNAGV